VDVATLFEDAQPSPSLASVKLRVAYTVAHAPPSPVREDAAGEQRAQVRLPSPTSPPPCSSLRRRAVG
jgi:hypothetical protein